MTAAVSSPGTAATGPDLTYDWQRMARSVIWLGLGAALLAIGAMLAWLVLAPLSGSVVAMGMVKVDTNRKTVQHRDGGIISAINVHEGERVAAGQVLVELDDSRIDATLSQASNQLDAMRIRKSRLLAERDLRATWTAPGEFRDRDADKRLAEIIGRESSIFTTRRNALDSQLRQLGAQAEQASREVAARQRESASIQIALKYMQEEVAVNESLVKENFVNKTRVMGLQRQVAEYEIKQGENAAELASARRSSADLSLRIDALRDTYLQEASTELRDVSSKIVDLEEQLGAIRDTSERKQITAPVAGRVVDLRVTTVGGTLGPRDPVLDIVPDDAPLLVEARVPIDAVAELRIGQPADVRLTAYPQRETPLIDARIVYISADALTDRHTGAPYFAVHAELDRNSLTQAGDLVVSPGMGAELFVRTRERTTLDFLLEPLVDAMRLSLRER